MTEVRPGLRRWTVAHPEAPDGWAYDEALHWAPEVGCLYLETPEALVLIDPLAPPSGTADQSSFWRMLEEDIARTGHLLDIVVTSANEWQSHVRSAPEIRDRYPGSRVWAPEGSLEQVLKRTNAVTDWFLPGDELPGGIQAFATVLPGEVVIWLPKQHALVTADVIAAAPDGNLCLMPDSWLLDGVTHEADRAALLPLLELPIEMVLVSHGEPVVSDGHAALARALVA